MIIDLLAAEERLLYNVNPAQFHPNICKFFDGKYLEIFFKPPEGVIIHLN